jgi:hypothetical protein
MATPRARPIDQPVVENLPSYLGFGTLDPGSIRIDGEHLIARYQYADGSTAYQIDWQPGHCLLEAQFEDEPIVCSGDRDLQGALFQSFLGRGLPAEDPRFVDLCQRVVTSGNIYFQFPGAFRRGSPGYLYYPAGLLFGLRLPIAWENRPAWDVFQVLTMAREDLPMSLFAEGPGAIVSLFPDGELRVDEIEIAQFVAPLCRVVDACRILAAHQLIAPGQTYRMVVADASATGPGGFQVYQGHEAGGPALFAMVAADPTSELSWKDQVALAGDRLVEFAAGVASTDVTR